MNRTHQDRCPGVLRPWIAEDGALVRLRLVGGATTAGQLRQVLAVADAHGDGTVLLTRRANLQLRGLAHDDGRVHPTVRDEIEATGLLPSPTHELVRNILVSPLSGLLAGRADLRPLALDLDAALCAEESLSRLSARFLFVLDDGRGDVADRDLDLGAMAVDAEHAQLRVGGHRWGEVVSLTDLPEVLVGLARRFVELRGWGTDAPWHVDELDDPDALIGTTFARDLRTQVRAMPLRPGVLPTDDGGTVTHVEVPDGVLTTELAADLLDERPADAPVVVTPWRGLLLPDPEVES